jgi:5-methylcytosine-specific restriction enzyme A
MSNRRKPARYNRYRSDFLKSEQWRERRTRWFDEQRELRLPLACAACGKAAIAARLVLHHLDYRGVQRVDGGWTAAEPHEDLVPLHADCHELLHRLIDRDMVLARHRSRRDATVLALARLHAKLTELEAS